MSLALYSVNLERPELPPLVLLLSLILAIFVLLSLLRSGSNKKKVEPEALPDGFSGTIIHKSGFGFALNFELPFVSHESKFKYVHLEFGSFYLWVETLDDVVYEIKVPMHDFDYYQSGDTYEIEDIEEEETER